MTVLAIIQARMGSTRLPGKVLMDIAGRTMLSRVVRRAARAAALDKVVVATTLHHADEPVESEARALGVGVYRGSEQDVLDRYCQAARQSPADMICRITSDCPLIDPGLIDRVVESCLSSGADYASNTLSRTFPRGLDVEVFSHTTLERAWREASEPYQRVHVTPYVYQHPERFRLVNVEAPSDLSAHRWTVDTPEDLELVRRIYADLGSEDSFGWREALDLVRSDPPRFLVNSHIQQKALEDG